MKKKAVLATLLFLFLLSLFGCAAFGNHSAASEDDKLLTQYNAATDAWPEPVVPNTENYSINEAIVCEQYDYTKIGESSITNLTGAGDYSDDGLEFFGVQLLRSYEDYEATLQKALAEKVYILQKVQNAHGTEQLSAENFEQYDYLMVDFMVYGAVNLYPRLDHLLVQDCKVSVDLLFDGFFTSAADNCGVLYFIPIPKGCTEAEVTPIYTSFAG